MNEMAGVHVGFLFQCECRRNGLPELIPETVSVLANDTRAFEERILDELGERYFYSSCGQEMLHYYDVFRWVPFDN